VHYSERRPVRSWDVRHHYGDHPLPPERSLVDGTGVEVSLARRQPHPHAAAAYGARSGLHLTRVDDQASSQCLEGRFLLCPCCQEGVVGSSRHTCPNTTSFRQAEDATSQCLSQIGVRRYRLGVDADGQGSGNQLAVPRSPAEADGG
jgi:hypothetical protein